jgi:nucleoside-diphosphate-sugar epimerase
VAAFIVEPVQGRQVTLPPDGYLHAAQELCRRHGTLFVLDEVQTGLGRTGRWFALEREHLSPDFVLVGKALSGGYMPVAAMATTRDIYQRAVGTLERSYVHQSTFGRNRLSMAAGLATLRIIARDRLVEQAAGTGAFLLDELRTLAELHPMLSDVRGDGLMIGIELTAPETRMAKLSWRLIHLATEGLFPQLVVIPLHRDHGIITMAAGKNDVIKLLPPLTLSRDQAEYFVEALDAVLSDCERSGSQSWREVRLIAQNTLRRNAHERRSAHTPQPFRGGSLDTSRDDVCLVTGASGFIGGHLVERLVSQGTPVRCLVRPSSDTRLLDHLGVQIAIGDLSDPESLARAADGVRYVFHCGALVSDWASVEEIRRINVEGTRNVISASVAASVQRVIHFSSTDVYGHPGERMVSETHPPVRFSNWYSQTKLQAEAAVRDAQAKDLDTVILRPATIYGPRSVNVVGEIAKAIRTRKMLLIGGGRATAGLCFIDNLIDAALLAMTDERASGETFNVTDGLDVTWRGFVDDLAHGLGCPPVRWSAPYSVASGLGFALEHGYRLVHGATGLQTAPLLSRQAVDVMGRNQSFSNAKLQVLGWRPRVSYEDGLLATVNWLTETAVSV